METEHQMLDLPCGQEKRIKDASMRTMRQNVLRAMQTSRNTLRSGNYARERKKREETRQKRASPQEKEEEGKTYEDTAENKDPQLESDNPAALDKLLRQMQERGPTSDHGMVTENGNLDQIDK